MEAFGHSTEVEIPLNKWLLTFKKETKLEESYQNYSAQISLLRMHSPITLISSTMIPIWFLLLYLHYYPDEIVSEENEEYYRRRIYWDLIAVPILLFICYIERFLIGFKCFRKFRTICSTIALLYQMADSTVYIYQGLDVFSTSDLMGAIFCCWIGESIIYNWIIFMISLLIGCISVYLRLYFGKVYMSGDILLGFILIPIALTVLCRLSETQRRNEFYLRHLVTEREKEWKRVLSKLPVGIIINQNNYQFENNNLENDIKYYNTALQNIFDIPDSDNPIAYDNQIDREKDLLEIQSTDCTRITLNINMLLNRINTSMDAESNSRVNVCNFNTPKEISYEINKKVKELKVTQIYHILNNSESTIIIIQDLTLIKAAERDRLSKEFQGRLVRTINHEIRTPLNVVKGSVEILENISEEEIQSKFKIYLKSINGGIIFLQKFIECMLQLSKYKNEGKLELNTSEFEMQGILEELIPSFQLEASRKELSLRIEVDINVPNVIIQDAQAISQLVFIILQNSLKYTFNGYISLVIIYRPPGELILTFRDTGIGISQESQKHLFQLYSGIFLPDSEFGTGVGLTLCKALVDGMEGQISLESELGEGTTIIVNIPIQLNNSRSVDTISAYFEGTEEGEREGIELYAFPATSRSLIHYIPNYMANTENMSRNSRNVEENNREALRGPTNCLCANILIVDDVASNIFVLQGMLNILNLRSEKASNGVEAIEMAKAASLRTCCGGYSLIFMDCNMPIKDGYQATLEIRELIKVGQVDPCNIIACTAYDSLENAKRCYQVGMDYVISKPVALSHLKKALLLHNILL